MNDPQVIICWPGHWMDALVKSGAGYKSVDRGYLPSGYMTMTALAEFARLIDASAREGCAKICDDMALHTGQDCAKAIRED